MGFHEVVMHGVVRKLLTYRQTNKPSNKQTRKNINSISISLAEIIMDL